MSQANRVHSTPPTNTPTSRRGFLSGTAAALAAGTAVNVAALVATRPAAAASDPILAAIEAHKAAVVASLAVLKRFSAFEDELADNGRLQYEYRNDEEGRRGLALEAERDAAYDAEAEAACAMLNASPTTLAGVVALLTYVRDHDESNHGMGFPDDMMAGTFQAVLIANMADLLPELVGGAA